MCSSRRKKKLKNILAWKRKIRFSPKWPSLIKQSQCSKSILSPLILRIQFWSKWWWCWRIVYTSAIWFLWQSGGSRESGTCRWLLFPFSIVSFLLFLLVIDLISWTRGLLNGREWKTARFVISNWSVLAIVRECWRRCLLLLRCTIFFLIISFIFQVTSLDFLFNVLNKFVQILRVGDWLSGIYRVWMNCSFLIVKTCRRCRI